MPGMIVAPQPLAVETGAKVLADGGNAYDAALACAAVQFILDPHSCGVGGYLLLTHHRPDERDMQNVLDAPATAGSKCTPTMWEERVLGANPGGWGFYLKDKVNDDGYTSICTPSMLRGMQEIHTRWCTKPWAELLAPAIKVAHEGFSVDERLAIFWKYKPKSQYDTSMFQKLHVSPDARRIYLKADGSSYEPGERLRNPDYGRTLERLAQRGAEDFYTGDLASEINADLERNGSNVTASDLAEYRVRNSQPVVSQYRDYTIVSPPAPHGGPTLATILSILEGFDLQKLGHNSPEYLYKVALAMKFAFYHRNVDMGDPEFAPTDATSRLSLLQKPESIEAMRDAIDKGREIPVPPTVQPGSKSTTHVSVVDRWGNCVALTHSLGMSSGVITPGLGFMYNNSMINFHPYAGHPNSIAPRKSRTTGMCPTLVFNVRKCGNKPVMVIGAPGATRIITSIAQVILNRLEFKMSMAEAVLAPRIDCQGAMISCQNRIPESVCAEVRKRHPIQKIPQSHGGFAFVHAIAMDEATGKLSGGADTGTDGMALEVP